MTHWHPTQRRCNRSLLGQVTFLPPHLYELGQVQVSVQGGSLQFSQEKMVMLLPLQLGTLIQTDKGVYKPGQHGEGRETLEELAGSWDGTSRLGSRALVLTPALGSLLLSAPSCSRLCSPQ